MRTLPTEHFLTRREMRDASAPLESVVASYLRAMRAERRLADRTQDLYVLHFAQYAKWLHERGRPGVLADIDPDVVRTYFEWRYEHGFKGAGSANQARLACVALKSLASWLADEKILVSEDGVSVLDRVRVPKVDDETRRPLEDDELRSVLRAAGHVEKRESSSCARDYGIVVLLASTGIRFGELLGLRLCDVDWDDQQLRIRAATAKLRRSREVTLHHEALAALDHYVQDERRGTSDPEAPLFTTQDGGAFSRCGLQKLFRRLKLRSGVAHFSAHVLRHTWLRNYRRAGSGDLEEARREGGWTPGSFAKMLARYGHERTLEERRLAPSPNSVLGDNWWTSRTRSALAARSRTTRIAYRNAARVHFSHRGRRLVV